MKLNFLKRVLVLALTFCLVLTMIPLGFSTHNDVEAVSGVNSLTCSSYISNSIARNYIDKMMRYYINNNSSLSSTLDNGLAVVFMFEGGSDNYWGGSDYTKSDYDVRNQAVCIVVKKNSSGNAEVVFVNESSCSIPGDPTWCTGASYSGSTTLMDGIYSFYTWNHTGPYAAFQCSLSSSNGCGYYTPPASPNGYQNGASGINIHTRSTNIAGGQSLGWVWSAGCQLISYGGDTGNEFNNFMKKVCGITWNSWINYSSKTFNTWASSNVGINKGYYVVDRQLGLMNASGTKYGSGSLINLYNKTALTNITAKSTSAASAAGADKVDYLSQCTYYPSYGNVKVTADDVWTRTLPCYSSVDSSAASISQYNSGDTLTVTGLYKNTAGEYWYRTTSSSGATVYFNGAYAEFTKKLTSDIKFTGHNPPNGHTKGTGYVIDGKISSTYNRISNVSAYVYKGFGTSGENLTGTSVSVSTTSYNLAGSAVDDATWMNVPDLGPNTLQIKMQYQNYYVSGGTLKSNGGTMTLATDYFMIVSAAKDQNSCSHSYTNYVMTAATCTTNGESIQACTTCGYIKGKVTTTGSHSYGAWETTTPATCVTQGIKTRICSKCGNKQTEVISSGGHNYTSKYIDATCVDYKRVQYTCSLCGDSYAEYEDARVNWTETKPAEQAGRTIETKTLYRYSDYSTTTSYSSTLDGYTLEKSGWEKTSTGTVNYVKSWPSGFSTSNSLYNTYKQSPKSAVTNTNDKLTIDSDKVVGYLYYHWCYTDSYYATSTNKDDYTTFHAYYSTTAPGNYQCDTSDMSYCTNNDSCCTNTDWYYVVEVKQQTYSNYKMLYTFGRWTDFSEWSDTPATASSTKKVETKSVYRSVDTSTLGSHNYHNGVCTVCQHAEPDYYLFGFINGADYACEGDSNNLGIYKFVDGKLTAEFTENSYVGFKSSDNMDWYMTDGYPGDGTTSAIFYNTKKGINAEKLFVPKGIEVTFTLESNGDGSYTLSYDLGECEHKNHNTNGNCTICSVTVEHNYVNDVCTVCGKAAPAYVLFGFINGADYEGIEYRFFDGVIRTKFTTDAYVAVKLTDGTKRFMTDGYLGEEVTSAVLYDSEVLGIKSNKLFVPGGKYVTFTLVDNGDGTFTLSYTVEGCAHTVHDVNGECVSCHEKVSHSYVDGVCAICGFQCVHSWNENDVCTECAKEKPVYCLFGFINGADYDGTEYQFVDGTLTLTFNEATYVAIKTHDNSNWYMTDGYQGENASVVKLYNTKTLGDRGDKVYIPKGREITFTLIDNGDDTFTFSYVASECKHAEHNINGICLACGSVVEHNLVNGNCTICGNNCNHNWVDGVCTECNRTQPAYYLYGFINGADYDGNDYVFKNGLLVTKFTQDSYIAIITDDRVNYMTDGYLGEGVEYAILYNTVAISDTADKIFVPGNREVVFVLVENGNGTLTLLINLGECSHPDHNAEGNCTSCGGAAEHNFRNGFCEVCDLECTHNFVNSRCTICTLKEPDYYLFGNINGLPYACEDDYKNIGIYKFVNGKITVLFTQDSFIGVKTGDNFNWFMTDGYLGDQATTATLYNTKVGINADKLFIPGGRVVTIYLVSNPDGTLTITYEIAPCTHATHNIDGVCYICSDTVEHNYVSGLCYVCGKRCEHIWVDGSCTECKEECVHLWSNGKCSRCELVCAHNYKDGECTICSVLCKHNYVGDICSVCNDVCEHNWIGGACFNCHKVCEHNYESGVCTICALRCNHNYINGACTVCGVVCGHKWYMGLCLVCDSPCIHNWNNGVCTLCRLSCEHIWSDGDCLSCDVVCEHTWENGVCTNCADTCNHNYVNSVCTVCGASCAHRYAGNTCTVCNKTTNFYLIGTINGSKVGLDENYLQLGSYMFKNGTLTLDVTKDSYVCLKSADNSDWYMADSEYTGKTAYLYNTNQGKGFEYMYIPAGVKVQLTLTNMTSDSFKLSYTVESCSHTYHNAKGKCIVCAQSVEHDYVNDVCAQCSTVKPMKDMYLFGIINGNVYGYNTDAENIGTYKFVDKKLTAVFDCDSYVAIKSFDNEDWYMTDSSAKSASAVMYNTKSGLASDLMFVPGGVEVRFTLTNNGDGTYTIKYETVALDRKEINLKYTTLSMDEGFKYSVFFTTTGLESADTSDFGLLMFNRNDSSGNIYNAQKVFADAKLSGNYLVVSTDALLAYKLVDNTYMKVYAKLSDGTYVYSDIVAYSGVKYANNILASKYSTSDSKALAVSLLNYISASQKYYGYKTNALANANLTAEQRAYAKEYSEVTFSKVTSCDTSKAGEFTKQGTGTFVYPQADFDDATCTLTYNLNTSKQVTGEVTMYYWTQDVFENTSVLTKENATGKVTMTLNDKGVYVAELSGIATKDIHDAIYVSAVFESESETNCSGVLAYSVAEYCKIKAQTESDIQELAQAAAIFGYYANQCL